jgi:hypothetical protein
MNYRDMLGKSVQTAQGWGAQVLPFFKWRRPDGPASFFTDRLNLRKSLSLCHTCEHFTLPSKWIDRYNYQQVRQFHGDGIGCDYCRAEEPTNLYIPIEGTLAADYRLMEPSVRETKRREREHRYVY